MQYGYYAMDLGAGRSQQVASITTAGQSALNVFVPDAASLAGLDALVVWNEEPTGYSNEFLANKTAIWDAVYNGMNLIIHDRYVTNAATILPGAGALATYFGPNGSAANDLDIVDNAGPIASGPGGALTDTSLDGGTNSSQGYVVASSLPAGAEILVTQGDANRVVTFGYQYGTGHVYYSTIPLDYYLRGFGGTAQLQQAMRDYDENLLAFVADHPTNKPVVLDAVNEDIPYVEFSTGSLLRYANNANGPLTFNGLQIGQGGGSLASSGPGIWRYTPAPNDDTSVTFTYSFSDNLYSVGGVATLDLLPVNDAPVVDAASLTLSEGQTVTLSAANFSITDPDSTSFTFTLSGVTGGDFQLSTAAGTPITTFTSAQLADGLVQFVDDGDEVAPAFSITASDGSLSSNTRAATIGYTGVNDPPVFVAPTFTIDEDGTFSVFASDLLAYSSDPDGDALAIQDFRFIGLFGGSTIVNDGPPNALLFQEFYFRTAINDETSITLTFSVTDGTVSVPVSMVVDILPINDAPAVSAASLALNEGQTVTLSAANFSIIDPDNTSFTFSLSGVTGGYFQLGTAAGTPITTFTSAQLADGLVQFVDDGDEVAPAFSIAASDGSLSSNARAATIAYTPVNDAPTTSPVTLVPVNEDTPLTITQAMLLAHAADVDLPAQTLVASNLQITGGGQLLNHNNGTWTFTPALNDDTGVSFSYTIGDGTASVAGSAKLDLLPVNDPPVAVADLAQASAVSGAVNIAVLANDSDVDGGPLTVSAITQGSSGSVAIRADGVSVRYVPNPGFSGFDTFTYTANDGAGGTAVGTVRVLTPSYVGTSGNDVPLGTPQADFIVSGDGNDRVLAYGGDDFVDGGRGLDTVSGGLGNDTLFGGDGADTFLTTAAELAGDSIDGGDAIDTLQITDPIAVMPAAFTLVNVEQLSFPGSLQVGHTSLLDLSALTLSGTGNQINGGTAATRITGTRSNDRITDSAGNDDLRGGDGNDTIMAGVGQDTVYGGRGNDTLGGSASTLGDGSVDTFVFNTPLNALTNVDTIIGFEATSRDVIALDSSIFSAIGATLDAGELLAVAGGLAADANDFILYDTATGALYYDADGSGAGVRVPFATLGAGLTGTVDASDFTLGSFPG